MITLLFADVEGSTAIVESLAAAYAGVLADYRRLVREAVEAGGGGEVEASGDELFAVFPDAAAALAAAESSQRALLAHDWPRGVRMRVRMGVHTGEPERAEGGYVGLDVHRAARVCDAGHGGQVLVSEVTAELVDAELRDLGEHRLKGLPRAERIFQLVGDGLEQDFPPLRGTEAAPQPVNALRVLLAEDSVLLREGIARLLEDVGFEVVAQAGTYDELMLRVRSYKPDVAIVDIRMPPTGTDEGLRAAKEIRETQPETKVLVLSQYVETGYAMELLAESAEGVGYLLKDRVSDVDEFCAAVRRVAEGGSALDPAVVSQLVGRRRRDDPLEAVTPREREVLELMAEGRSNDAIGKRLFITPRAVEKHVTSIFQKLHLPATAEDHRRVLAVLTLLRAE